MEKDKISVIIPVYNLENYIERTLHSVCNQSYKNLEIIVIDDGSTDNSWNVIKEYAKSDSRVICIHQDNHGVTSARLNGLNHSTGDWIGFVDGDDEIDEDMFDFLINNAHQYQADISHCGYKMMFDDGRINFFYGTKQVMEQDNLRGQKDLLEGNPIEPGLWNKLYKREVVDKADLNASMDLSLKINEDLLMNFLLFQQSNKSVFADECKYGYIVRAGSASRSYNRAKIFDPIKVRERIIESADESVVNLAKKVYLSTCINVYSSILFLPQADKNDIKSIRKRILSSKNEKKLLGKKQRILFDLIVYMPYLYKVFYKIYAKYFQIRKYD